MSDSPFTDHGVAVAADENRAPALFHAPDGTHHFVIPSKGHILTVHLDTGKQKQVPFPEGYIQYPFQSFVSSRGKVYTGAGTMFLEFDPLAEAFTFHAQPCATELNMAFCVAEGPDGTIWFASHPSCRLFSYNPDTHAIRDFGRMDDTEKYVGTIAPGRDGWVYLGIGTERCNMVAFNPGTGERRNLIPEEARKQGSCCVHLGPDGEVYGRDEVWLYYEMIDPKRPRNWRRFRNGEGEPLAQEDVPHCPFHTGRFVRNPSADAELIRDFSLAERELVYIHPQTGAEALLRLEYESNGAHVAPMTLGPDGHIYGTSAHPMHLFRVDPRTGAFTDFGGKILGAKTGGGNICAYASQGTIMIGAHYSGGHILRFDLSHPIEPGVNPSIEAQCEAIHRPRSAIAHPDGRRVILGGFAGYGAAGGALCVYDCIARTHEIIPNAELVPFQSTLAMAFAANGDLLGGCSVETPGGATPKTTQAELYRYSLDRRELLWRTVPIPEAREIAHIVAGPDGRLHGITNNSIYFVFDPETRAVMHREDVSAHGAPVRHGMMKGPDGMIYGLLAQVIYRIDPERAALTVLATTPEPVGSGMAVTAESIYFASTAHLWSYRIAE